MDTCKRLLLLLIILFSVKVAYCTGLLLPWSARSSALNCHGIISSESGSIFTNPALGDSELLLSSSYLYNLRELPRYTLSGGYNIGDYTLCYAIEHLGHEYYKETGQLVSIEYNWNEITGGIALRDHLLKIGNEKYEHGISCDAGIYWRGEGVQSAISIVNCFGNCVGAEKLPVYITGEMCIAINSNGSLGLRLEKEDGYDFMPSIAGSYAIASCFEMVSSYGINPGVIGCGFSVKLGRLAFDYGLQYHQDLEESHYISLRYALY